MSNLFSRLKSHMQDQKSSYPGGRYLAMLLREVFIDEPGFAKEVFGIDSQKYDIELEYSFKGRQGRRRADLALLDQNTRKPLALLEIKYEDEGSRGVSAQTKDYLYLLKRNKNLRFRLLSQYPPEDFVLKQFPSGNRATHMSYAELYRQAERYKKDQRHLNPTLRLFCEFLKEETSVFNDKKIDKGALTLLMVKLLYVKHRHGLSTRIKGTRNSREKIVESIGILDQLTKNMGVLADDFSKCFGQGIFGNRPTIHFHASPYFNLDMTKKKIEKLQKDDNDGDDAELDRELKSGGYLYVGAEHVIRKSAYLWNGVSVFLDLSNKTSPLKVYVMAGIDKNARSKDEANLSILCHEKNLFKALKKVSLQAVKKSLKADSLARLPKPALTKLKERL